MKYSGITYWNKARNCGDGITSYIVRDVLGYEPYMVSQKKPHALCTGSIMFNAAPTSQIWGTGILDPTKELPPINKTQVHAIRGDLTRAQLFAQGTDVSHVAQGDPGVLVSRIPQCVEWLHASRVNGCQFQAAIIPHFESLDHPAFDVFRNMRDFVFIDMRNDTLKPLQAICQAEVVISQSLHGLIFAEALGKPTLWISEKANAVWTFKFRDWYTNCDNAPAAPMMLSDLKVDSFRHASARPLRLDLDALTASYPASQVEFELDGPVVDFESARAASPHWIIDDELMSNSGTVLDDSNSRATAAIERALAKKIREAYAGWAERPVTLISNREHQASSKLNEFARNYLEANKSADMIWIISRERVASLPDGAAMVEWNSVPIVKGMAIHGEAVGIRATSGGSVSRRLNRMHTAII